MIYILLLQLVLHAQASCVTHSGCYASSFPGWRMCGVHCSALEMTAAAAAAKVKANSSDKSKSNSNHSSSSSSSSSEEADAARRGLTSAAALLLSAIRGLTQQTEWNFDPDSEDETVTAAGTCDTLERLHTAAVRQACAALQDYVRAELFAAQCQGAFGISTLPAAVALKHINNLGLNCQSDPYTLGPPG
jgi:hypothetical protein